MGVDLVVAGYAFNQDRVLLVHNAKLDLWLPPGGHIKKGETFDAALRREFKEETNLDIKFLGGCNLPVEGYVKSNLATPFYVNVHAAGERDNCCLFYICEATNPGELRINSELKEARWHSMDDLRMAHVPADVQRQGTRAFVLYHSYTLY